MNHKFSKQDGVIQYVGDGISWHITHEALQDYFGLRDLEGGLQCAEENEGVITARALELKADSSTHLSSIVKITTSNFN